MNCLRIENYKIIKSTEIFNGHLYQINSFKAVLLVLCELMTQIHNSNPYLMGKNIIFGSYSALSKVHSSITRKYVLITCRNRSLNIISKFTTVVNNIRSLKKKRKKKMKFEKDNIMKSMLVDTILSVVLRV